MSADAELHDRLGEAIGLAQAMRALARRAAALVEPELARGLDALVRVIEELQRRCDSLVARHAELRQSRVIARAREVRARATRPAPASAETSAVLAVLAAIAQRAVVGWRALAAWASSEGDVEGAQLVHVSAGLLEAHVEQLARHLPPLRLGR